MNNYKSYSLKIWLTSVFLPPFITLLFILTIEGDLLSSILPYYFIFCFAALLVSLIPFLVFQEINKRLFKKIVDPIQLKLTINLQALLWGLLPFFIILFCVFGYSFPFGIDSELVLIILLYPGIITSSVWLYKIERELIFEKKPQEDLLDDDFNFKK